MSSSPEDAWGPALDALEEWLRRARDQLAAGQPMPPAIPLPAVTLPACEQLRVQVLLQKMAVLEADAAEHRVRLHRGYTYRR